MSQSEIPTTPDDQGRSHRLRMPRFRWVLAGGVGVVLLLWIVPTFIEAISGTEGIEGFERPYLLIFSFVAFDAVIPIFPSESLLTTASAAAAQPGSDLTLWLIVLAGGFGALVGDSMLYWLSRTVGRGLFSRQLEKARENEKATAALEVLGDTGPLLITVGRFVPGVRFIVNATMGLGRYPYPKFLLFSTIGGFAWAAYTCLFSYAIGNALSGYPVLSIATSVLITTAFLALLYVPLKRRYERARDDQQDDPPGSGPDGTRDSVGPSTSG